MNLVIFKGYESFSDEAFAYAVKHAMNHRDQAIPELLEILDHTIDHSEAVIENPNYFIHIPAIHLLAFFRETKAYGRMIRLASLPEDQLYDLIGDDVTECFKNILASVCDGAIEPIQAIVENPEIEEFVRAEALSSLLVLFRYGVVTREFLVTYFKGLFSGRLEPEYSFVWCELIICCAKIHPLELKDDIERAIKRDNFLKQTAELGLVDRQLALPMEDVIDALKNDEEYSYIGKEDIESILDWIRNLSNEEEDAEEDDEGDDWEGFDEDEEYKDGESEYDDDGYDEEPVEVPFRREPTVGRNDPCPCGSGKKYKKCCMGKEQGAADKAE